MCVARAGYSIDSTTMPMLMFMIPLITELLVHFAAFAQFDYRLPHVPTDKTSLPLPTSAAALSYGPATAT